MKVRSATIYRLLCAAIVVLALALLAMVGWMVYPYLPFVPQKAVVDTGKPAARPVVAARPTLPPITKSTGDLQVKLFPPPAVAGPTKLEQSHGGYRYVGSILEEDGASYALLQREKDESQMLCPVGILKDDVLVKSVSKDKVELEIAKVAVTLAKVDAMNSRRPKAAPQPGVKPGMPGSRLDGGPVTIRSSSFTAPTGGQPVTTNVVTNTPTGSSGAADGAGAVGAATPGTVPGVATDTRGANWRQQWSDRQKQVIDRRRTTQPGGNNSRSSTPGNTGQPAPSDDNGQPVR